MTIRDATPADAELLATLRIASREGSFPELVDDHDRNAPFWAKRWRGYLTVGSPAQMSRGDGFAIVVELAGRPVGYAAWHHTRHDTDVELESIYLLPEAQGRGLGSALLGTVGGRVYADGSRSMCVGYDPRNPYKRFYARHGAVEINPHWAVWRDLSRIAAAAPPAEPPQAESTHEAPGHRMHDQRAIIQEVLNGYTLYRYGHHGITHWARVLENGLRLAEETGADVEVVTLFALFHDARRENEGDDPAHGRRGGDLARALRGTLVHLDDCRFELLHEACCRHTDGMISGDITLLTCWDADRLDLGRVGIRPEPRRLGTPAARALIKWAHGRATQRHIPQALLSAWGVQ